MLTFLLKEAIPCTCEHRVEHEWGDEKTTAYPMFLWRKKGFKVYYKCFKCGAIKSLSTKEAMTEEYRYISINSNGEAIWKCPVHGYHMHDVPSTKAPDEIMDAFIETAERGYKQPCCIVEQKRHEEDSRFTPQDVKQLCVHCNKPSEIEPLIKLPCSAELPCDIHICKDCLDHTNEDSLAYKLCSEECPNATAKRCDCNTRKYFEITSIGKTGTLPLYTCRCNKSGVEVEFVPNGEWLDYLDSF